MSSIELPKSPKLQKELELESKQQSQRGMTQFYKDDVLPEKLLIKKVECINDFCALLLRRVETTLALSEDQKFKNEGVVVGFGPGLADGAGGRLKSQLNLGDVVVFHDRNIVMDIRPDDGVYKDHRIVIISEKSLICKLAPIEFELVT